jgi:LysM repeat protein
MKRILLLLGLALSLVPSASHAQDAAVMERLNQLTGKIEDLIAGQDTQRKRIAELSREIDALREQQQNTPKVSYASPEDLKRVAKAVEEVDRKRMADYEKVSDAISKLGKHLASATPPAVKPPREKDKTDETPHETADKKGFEYVVKSGDTLSLIAQAYRENNIKVTPEQILAANPGLKAERLTVGKKIFIPAPK